MSTARVENRQESDNEPGLNGLVIESLGRANVEHSNKFAAKTSVWLGSAHVKNEIEVAVGHHS